MKHRALPAGRQAFTLVELLVVIAIIGLLSTVATLSLVNTRSRSRDAKRLADMRQIVMAFQMYYEDYGKYPYPSGELGCVCGGAGGACCLGHGDGVPCHANTGQGCTDLNEALEPYMARIPDDPENAPNTYGDAYLYADQSVTGWVTPTPALHWGYDQVSNATNCLGGVFGQWPAGAAGRSRYWCALTLRP